MGRVRVGTRGSALALAQARAVSPRLGEPAELVTVTTAGDRNRAAGDKSRWTGALERALLAGEIDLAVHSAKDVPGELAPGTALLAAPPRADAADVLVGRPDGLDALRPAPAWARAPCAAARSCSRSAPDLDGGRAARQRRHAPAQARRAARSTRSCSPAPASRGSSCWRTASAAVRLPDGGEVPAAALDGDVFVPAAGQGTLASQGRAERPARARGGRDARRPCRVGAPFRPSAPRSSRSDADCHTPVGIHAAGGGVRGFAGLPDGSRWVLDELEDADGDPAATGGAALAARLLAAGAADLLARAEAEAAT